MTFRKAGTAFVEEITGGNRLFALDEDILTFRGMSAGADFLATNGLIAIKDADGGHGAKIMRGDKYKLSTEIDKILQNDPAEVSKVADAVKLEVENWRKSILPSLGKKGKLETFIKTWIICVNRSALGISNTYRFSREEIEFCKIHVVKDWSLFKNAISKNNESISNPPSPIATEAVINCSSLHFKLWDNFLKPTPKKGTAGTDKFLPLFHLINFWEKIVDKWYGKFHDHSMRDSKIGFITNMKRDEKFLNPKTRNGGAGCCPLIDYTSPTANEQRFSDYLIKLYLELVLSPHIHIEWKLDMAKLVSDRGINMMKAFKISSKDEDETDSSSGTGEAVAEDVVVPNLQPCAARFWDFCRGGVRPGNIEYAIITPEPSSDPCVSTGASIFGKLVSKYKNETHSEKLNLPRKAIGILMGVEEPCTRRWVEEGNVLLINYNPLTLSESPLGTGRYALTSSMPKGFFVSGIIRSILNSRKRGRNAHDKGGQNSDLMSDGSSVSIRTVVFGCKTDLDALPIKATILNKELSFEGDILGGSITAKQLSAYSNVRNCFPSL